MFLVSSHNTALEIVGCFTLLQRYSCSKSEKFFIILVSQYFLFQTDENSWKSEAEIDMELFHQV